MSLPENTRARALTGGLFVFLIAAVCTAAGFFNNSRVLAAKHAIAAEDARVAAQFTTPAVQHPGANPVLVELFTSEGCSDCPPADTLLARLQHDQPVTSANIIALEEHVDYWDHLGWRDRFSSPDITARQNRYTERLHLDDNYTPQMIVDGADQFVGSDSAHALRAITSAARVPKLTLRLSSVSFSGRRASGTVSLEASRASVDLYAALIQRTSSTNVLRGENGGHTLQHASTVLTLEKIGDASAPRSFSLSIPQATDPANLAVVAFAQEPGQGAILGAVSSPGGPGH